ncbi:glycosyltransferase family 2 protein [Cystobacter fuscus]|uniref:glycosyltransferase family 2 protein n=1 Tax=Cystobacter fuscus TaxID=43 RepID=UPI002B311C88|nr:glycosyltransferase family 2 protein [Cystobacter fuscus]
MDSPDAGTPLLGLGSHLRSWVLERVRADGRVALLGHEAESSAALEAVGCAVLEVKLDEGAPPAPGGAPPTEVLEALTRFAPTHVVLPLQGAWSLETWLGVLRRAVPDAELLFGFWNAGCASRLLATLVGRPSGRAGPSDAEVTRALDVHGFQVKQRHALRAPPGSSGLAEGTELALRSLLTQLNASAEADLLLYAVASAPTRPAAGEFVPGLLSVLVWRESLARPGLLDETLFSLACQEHQPLEVLLLGEEGAGEEQAVERHRRLGGFQFQRLEGSPPGAWSEALRRARGQYVAFLGAGSVVYPAHYARLVDALRRGASAWSVARAFRATCAPGAPGDVPYIESKRPFPLGEHLDSIHLLQEPELLQALVVDRTRVGPLCLEPEAQAAALPVRLFSLFEPVFLAEGLATCEVRSFSSAPPSTAHASPGLQMIVPLNTFQQALVRAHAEGASSRGLRFRVMDDLNMRLRERLPWLHGALRSMVNRPR